jgi:hypothetical protein
MENKGGSDRFLHISVIGIGRTKKK